MGFLDKLLKTVDIWLPQEEQENIDKGREFEKYIAGIFAEQEKYFSIEDWTKDYYNKRDGIKVESNKNPDLIVKYKPTGEKFAVECKFRSNPIKSEKINGYVVKWSYSDQIRRYNEFSKSNNIPVFVVIGLSGKPNRPKFMFCLPLEDAKYPEIFLSILDKYERPPDKPFFWKDGILK